MPTSLGISPEFELAVFEGGGGRFGGILDFLEWAIEYWRIEDDEAVVKFVHKMNQTIAGRKKTTRKAKSGEKENYSHKEAFLAELLDYHVVHHWVRIE